MVYLTTLSNAKVMLNVLQTKGMSLNCAAKLSLVSTHEILARRGTGQFITILFFKLQAVSVPLLI